MPAETLGRNRTRSEPAQGRVPAVAVPRAAVGMPLSSQWAHKPIQGGFHHCDVRDCLNSKFCINEMKMTHLSPAECSIYAFGDGSQFRNKVAFDRRRRSARGLGGTIAHVVFSASTLSAEAYAPGGAVRRNISNVVRCLVGVFLIIGPRLDHVGSCLIGIVAMTNIVAAVS